MTIPEQIKQIRLDLEWSQRELAKKMKVPQSTIARIESGEMNISQRTIETFCFATDTKVFIVKSPSDKLIFEKYNEIYLKYETLKNKLLEILKSI
jgi:transcriptional regulator with XRE-family HTH domain